MESLINTKVPDIEFLLFPNVSPNQYVTFKSFEGHYVVLYFYPKDNTPGCTKEAQEFQDLLDTFQKHNTIILGVSKDSIASHKRFSEKYQISFPLIADINGQLCEAFGVWCEKSMYGKKYMGIDRSTFLIDPRGIIQNVWRSVKVKNHAQEVLNVLETTQT